MLSTADYVAHDKHSIYVRIFTLPSRDKKAGFYIRHFISFGTSQCRQKLFFPVLSQIKRKMIWESEYETKADVEPKPDDGNFLHAFPGGADAEWQALSRLTVFLGNKPCQLRDSHSYVRCVSHFARQLLGDQ